MVETDTLLPQNEIERMVAFFEENSGFGKNLKERYSAKFLSDAASAVLHRQLAESFQQQGDKQHALENYEAYNRIVQDMYKDSPDIEFLKQNVALSRQSLCEMYADMGNAMQVMLYFEDFLDAQQALCEAYPKHEEFKYSLAVACMWLADINQQLGDKAKALEYFQEFCRHQQELHTEYPQNPKYANGLAAAFANLGEFYRSTLGDREQSRHYYLQALAIWQALRDSNPELKEVTINLATVNRHLEDL